MAENVVLLAPLYDFCDRNIPLPDPAHKTEPSGEYYKANSGPMTVGDVRTTFTALITAQQPHSAHGPCAHGVVPRGGLRHPPLPAGARTLRRQNGQMERRADIRVGVRPEGDGHAHQWQGPAKIRAR